MGSSFAALRRPRTGRYLAAASLGAVALALAAPAAAQSAQAPQIPPPVVVVARYAIPLGSCDTASPEPGSPRPSR